MQLPFRRVRGTWLLMTALLIPVAPAFAQISFPLPAHPPVGNITQAEYYFDTDPGFGNGISLPVGVQPDVTLNQTISVNGLTPGAHRFHLRAKDAAGNWGLSNLIRFYILPDITLKPGPAAANVTYAEYFMDTDPGFGNGTSIPFTAGVDITANGMVNTGTLSGGVHRIYTRVRDAKGNWSTTSPTTLIIIPSIQIPPHAGTAPVVKAEYFVDTDPGFGNGNDIPLVSGNDVTMSNVVATLGNLSNGVHNVFIRTKNANGNWSLSNSNRIAVVAVNVNIPPAAAPQDITALEYFFDTDPGFGNGTTVNIPASTTDLQQFQFTADVSTLTNGNHTLFVRSKGNWSVTNAIAFNIGNTTLPVKLIHFGATKEQETVLLQWKTTNEKDNRHFEVQRSRNALSFDPIGIVQAAGDGQATHHYELKDKQPLNGISYYRLKQVDGGGTFTYSPVISIRMGQDAGGFTVANPAHEVLYISSAVANMVYRVSDMAGRILLEQKGSGRSTEEIDISILPAGAYIVTGSNGKEQQYRRFTKN